MVRNKYIKHSKISERSFREILRFFSEDFDATQTSRLTSIGRKTVNLLFNKIRFRIYHLCCAESIFSGEVEADESYFGAKGKIPVFGLLKRNGKVFTQVIPSCSRKDLMPIIHGKVLEGSTVYTDGWKSYDGLVLNGYKHYRIHHHENEFARGNNHVNGIESFWSFTKRRMRKFNGIRKDQFLLHLKESEFRWNHRGGRIYKVLISELRKRPL